MWFNSWEKNDQKLSLHLLRSRYILTISNSKTIIFLLSFFIFSLLYCLFFYKLLLSLLYVLSTNALLSLLLVSLTIQTLEHVTRAFFNHFQPIYLPWLWDNNALFEFCSAQAKLKESTPQGENKGVPRADCPPLSYSASTRLATPRFKI